MDVSTRGKLSIALGACGLSIAIWGLGKDIGPIAQPFYAYAWWSYIFILDGIVAVRRGRSLLTTGRRHVFAIFVWSITFWFFFELLNLRYQNWYYVGVFAAEKPTDLLAGGLFAVACFSTVFFGLFETYEVLTVSGLGRFLRARPGELPGWVSYAIQAGGLFLIALSLLFPYYLSPLVWGSLTFLIDPWNYRHGARSVLWELSRGNWGLLLRLLLAGLLCGVVWEAFNFYAPQKWIYTVRGLEELKLFEMPLLGFLGFPALAADAFAAYAALSYLFHGNETWETSEEPSQPLEQRTAWSRARFATTLPLHFLLWGGITYLSQFVNVGSVELALEDLATLPSSHIETLRRAGVQRPRQLLEAARDPEEAPRIRRILGLDDERLADLREEIELYLFKGIGADHGRLLRQMGIVRVEQLSGMSPDELFLRLERAREARSFPALRPGMVRVWIHSAGRSPAPSRQTDGTLL